MHGPLDVEVAINWKGDVGAAFSSATCVTIFVKIRQLV